MTKLILNTDGGARGNPGPSAIGVVISDANLTIIKKLGKFIGTATNNEAEYTALIEGLKTAKELKATSLLCNLDSELVVKQLTGLYKVKEPRMKIFFDIVKSLENNFSDVTYKHIPRELNKEADGIVNVTLDSLNK